MAANFLFESGEEGFGVVGHQSPIYNAPARPQMPPMPPMPAPGPAQAIPQVPPPPPLPAPAQPPTEAKMEDGSSLKIEAKKEEKKQE